MPVLYYKPSRLKNTEKAVTDKRTKSLTALKKRIKKRHKKAQFLTPREGLRRIKRDKKWEKYLNRRRRILKSKKKHKHTPTRSKSKHRKISLGLRSRSRSKRR